MTTTTTSHVEIAQAPNLHRHKPRFASLASERKIVRRAVEILKRHPHFQGRAHLIEPSFEDQKLILVGCLPSFYLKQLAQEAMRVLVGVEIENRIVVSSSNAVLPR